MPAIVSNPTPEKKKKRKKRKKKKQKTFGKIVIELANLFAKEKNRAKRSKM